MTLPWTVYKGESELSTGIHYPRLSDCLLCVQLPQAPAASTSDACELRQNQLFVLKVVLPGWFITATRKERLVSLMAGVGTEGTLGKRERF